MVEYAKRILVTGGAGFIGSHIVIHLVKTYPQYYIVNFDRLDYCSCLENVTTAIGDARNYKFIKGNIMDSDMMEYVLDAEKIDTIMNFAAQSHVDNSFGNSFAFSKDNILGTHVLLEAAKKRQVERLFTLVLTKCTAKGPVRLHR